MKDRGQPAEPQGTPRDQLVVRRCWVVRVDMRNAGTAGELVARLRGAVSLREIMIHQVRIGYVGQDDPIDPKLLPQLRAVAGRPDTLRGVLAHSLDAAEDSKRCRRSRAFMQAHSEPEGFMSRRVQCRGETS